MKLQDSLDNMLIQLMKFSDLLTEMKTEKDSFKKLG